LKGTSSTKKRLHDTLILYTDFHLAPVRVKLLGQVVGSKSCLPIT
jgi:hypothetical protein